MSFLYQKIWTQHFIKLKFLYLCCSKTKGLKGVFLQLLTCASSIAPSIDQSIISIPIMSAYFTKTSNSYIHFPIDQNTLSLNWIFLWKCYVAIMNRVIVFLCFFINLIFGLRDHLAIALHWSSDSFFAIFRKSTSQVAIEVCQRIPSMVSDIDTSGLKHTN